MTDIGYQERPIFTGTPTTSILHDKIVYPRGESGERHDNCVADYNTPQFVNDEGIVAVEKTRSCKGVFFVHPTDPSKTFAGHIYPTEEGLVSFSNKAREMGKAGIYDDYILVIVTSNKNYYEGKDDSGANIGIGEFVNSD